MLQILLVIVGFLLIIELLALIRLKLHIGTFASYWKGQNEQAQGDLLYVSLGDSAAQGLGASEPEKGYVGLVSKALMEKNKQSVRRINLSVSGAKIKDVTIIQLPELNKQPLTSKSIITLEIGANEMRSFDESSFRNDMDELLSRVPEQTVVAEVPYFGGGRYRMYEKHVLVANDIIHELAGRYGLKVAPLYKITKARDSLKVYAADLFHPSNTGYKNWAEAFKQALNL